MDMKNDDMPELVDPKQETEQFHPPMDFTIKRKFTIKPALYFLFPCLMITFVLIFLTVTGSMELPSYIYVIFLLLLGLNYYIINLIRKTPFSVSIFSFQKLILIGYEQVNKIYQKNQTPHINNKITIYLTLIINYFQHPIF
jgi:hypothetical protein